jgi:hypothetical protein
MAEIIQQDGNHINYLKNNNRVFFPSENVNIFPCSRRGRSYDASELVYYDPEARLNTERTNRIGTAINGFTDSFIESYENNKLTFVLAGYRVEVKDFYPGEIASVLYQATDGESGESGVRPTTICAHLSLHTGISLNTGDYTTEILYRQSTANTGDIEQVNSLDVTYSDKDLNDNDINIDYFVGISFTSGPTVDIINDVLLPAHDLDLFKNTQNNNAWSIVQTSLLPKIKHGEGAGDSVYIHDLETENIEIDSANIGAASVEALIVNGLITAGGCTINASTNSITVGTVNAGIVNASNIPAIWVDDADGTYKLNITPGGSQSGGGPSGPVVGDFTIIDCGKIG